MMWGTDWKELKEITAEREGNKDKLDTLQKKYSNHGLVEEKCVVRKTVYVLSSKSQFIWW